MTAFASASGLPSPVSPALPVEGLWTISDLCGYLQMKVPETVQERQNFNRFLQNHGVKRVAGTRGANVRFRPEQVKRAVLH